MKVAIVGNGIIGLLSAFRLSQDSQMNIEIWGLHSKPQSGSNAAAAMLNSFGEVDKSTFSHEIGRSRFSHSQYAARLWDELLEENALGLEARDFGMGTFILKTGSHGSIELESWNEITSSAERLEEPHELVTAADISGYKPTPRFGAQEALYLPREGWVDPINFMNRITDYLNKKKNVTFLEKEAMFINAGKKPEVADAHNSASIYDVVALTNGFRARDFLERLRPGPEMPTIVGSQGTTLRLASGDNPQKHVIRTPNRGQACGLYSAPYGSEIVIGASSHVTESPTSKASLESVRNIASMAQAELSVDLHKASLVSVNNGVRPLSTDGVPLVGWVEEGVFICSGTRRDGWHLSPLLSEHIFNEFLDAGRTMEGMGIYDPCRLNYRFMSIEESIEEATRHYMSGLEQHGYNPPFGSGAVHFAENYRTFFSKLHDDLGLNYGLTVDMIPIAIKHRNNQEEYPF